MKKQVLAAMVGISMFAAPALAHGKDDKAQGRFMGLKLGIFKHFSGLNSSDQFVVYGTVQAVAADSFTASVKASANVADISGGMVTVKTDADTTIPIALAVGQNVVATGSLSSSDLLATKVQVLNAKAQKPATATAVGKVTAKTDNSVTITNTLANTSQTITTDADTKIKIDGQVKTAADINVGDSGWVRFKTVGATLIAKFIHLFR